MATISFGGGGEPQSNRLRSTTIFKVKWAKLRPHYNQISQNIAKSIANMINQSGGGFQQGDCLRKPTNGI